jgi:hypothetical protein
VKGRDHLDGLGVEGKYISMRFKGIECENVDFIHLSQITAQRKNAVSTAVQLLIP